MSMRFGFTYVHCNDLAAMKTFYSGILQLNQIWEDGNSLAYMVGDHQLSITLDPEMPLPPPAFAAQPGWSGGSATRTSWSLECDRDAFRRIVTAAQQHRVPSWTPEPTWVGYWSFPVLDPMSNTVEVTCPEQDGWPELPPQPAPDKAV